MIIVTWNVRGLGTFDKCLRVKNYLKSVKPDIIMLQETKIENPKPFIFKCLGWGVIDEWAFIPAVGTSGGIFTGWSSNSWAVKQEIKQTYCLHMALECKSTNVLYFFSNVYDLTQDEKE